VLGPTSTLVLSLDTNYNAEYKLNVEDIATFAMVIARIPDVQDEVRRARLPPSIHKPTAKLLLLGCVKAKDPLATLLILNAVLQSTTNSSPEFRRKSKEIASLLNSAEITHCRKELEALAAKEDSDAMNLLGQLQECEGQTRQARTLYEAAFRSATTKPDPESARTLFLTLVPAWNALGNLLLADEDPKAQTLAKAAFEKGALLADDPISYYHLASFENEKSANWLRYMNKAAATGHVEAMYKLGNQYLHINTDSGGSVKDAYTNDGQLKKALRWLSLKQDATQDLAEEWYGVAAECGYKPAMQELVKLSETKGDAEGVKIYLQKMIEPPPAGETEEWPRLVEEARRRLRG
jgi:TPR repeat protein